MEKLVIEGGRPLKGEVQISGAKNAVLPIMAATLLTDEPCIIRDVPDLRDMRTMAELLRSLGKKVVFEKNTLTVTSSGRSEYVADYKLVSTMRGSFCVLGPLLGKMKKAKVSLPGGCVIGVRPVDLHIKGLKALGVEMEIDGGYVIGNAQKIKGTHIYLGGSFGSSVLATDNVMMAAVMAQGETIIESAACEPEVEDLTNVLIKMGAKIQGKGGPTLRITGVKHLKGFDHTVIPDRIEAGTYILLAVATRSTLTVKGAAYSQLLALFDKLQECGANIRLQGKNVIVEPSKKIKPVSVTTHPHPGFPTDLQAQFMAAMALADGISVISDKIYPDRFMHIAELNRMGANIRREGINAIVEGVKQLHGAPIMASDLRASAALVIAGLAAQGTTEIHRIYHLERGYDDMDGKLRALGARVYREDE